MIGDSDVRPIVRVGDERLRRVCEPLSAGDPRVVELAHRLGQTLRVQGGVGLAAPQIGENLRLFVTRLPEKKRARQLVFVNPVLTETYGPLIRFEEGCLSFPDLYLNICRPRGVRLQYQDLEGRPRTLADEGLLARVIQHELDHLDGILFHDRLTGPRRWWEQLRIAWLARTSWGRTH